VSCPRELPRSRARAGAGRRRLSSPSRPGKGSSRTLPSGQGKRMQKAACPAGPRDVEQTTIAMAHGGAIRGFTAFSEAPTNAAYAPRRTFSAAYRAANGCGSFATTGVGWRPGRRKKSGPWERPRTKLSTSSRCPESGEAALVGRQRRPRGSGGRVRAANGQASSYSVRAFPAFWEGERSPERRLAVGVKRIAHRRFAGRVPMSRN